MATGGRAALTAYGLYPVATVRITRPSALPAARSVQRPAAGGSEAPRRAPPGGARRAGISELGESTTDPFATVPTSEERFAIDLLDTRHGRLECCIYAFLIGDEIVRIGSSKNPLRVRLRSWEGYVSSAFNGRKTPTPKREADGWKARLPEGVTGEVWAREGSTVATAVGTFNAYLSEESYLIGKHLPALNNSKHR